MRTQCIARKSKMRRLHMKARWLGLFACLFAIAGLARPEFGTVFAQASTPISSPQEASSQEQTTPAQGASAEVKPTGNEVKEVKEDTQALHPADAQPHRVADDSADLLKLANALKADVDKSTAETFSATAIREAQDIEKLAHKMRTK
jgi:hypothetical protein